MKKVGSIVLALVLSCVMFVGCAVSTATPAASSAAAPAASTAAAPASSSAAAPAASTAADKDQYFVGLAFGGLDAMPTVIMEKLTAKMDKLGWKYVVTNGDLDVNKYLSDLESLCQQGTDVIVTRTVSETVNQNAAEICTKAGVPVLLISNMTVAKGVDYLGHVADPELVRGIPLAQWLNKYVAEHPGFVPKVGFVVGNASTDAKGVCERSQNLRDYLTVDWKEVVSAEASPNWSASGAMQVVEDWMQKYTKDQLNTIICWSDEMTVGVIQALQAAGKNPNDYLLLSYDGLPLIEKYVADGWVDAASGLDIQKTVDKIMEVLQKVHDGKKEEVEFLNYANAIYIMDTNNVKGIADGSVKPEYFDYSSYIKK